MTNPDTQLSPENIYNSKAENDSKTLFLFGIPYVDINDLRACAKQYGFSKLCLVEVKYKLEGQDGAPGIFALRERAGGNAKEDFDSICVVESWKVHCALNSIKEAGPIPKQGDAIIGGEDHVLPSVYAVSNAYNIYPACANKGFKPHDKLQQRKLLSAKNLEQPKYQAVDIYSDTEESLQSALQVVGLPAILKALQESSSKGVYPVKEEADFKKVIEKAHGKYYGYGLSVASGKYPTEYLLEEYIPHDTSKEYCVEGNVLNGKVTVLGISEKIPEICSRDINGIFENFGLVNVPLTTLEAQEISPSISRWISALGYQNGPFNIDCMRTPKNENKFLEINYRPATSNFLPAEANKYSPTEQVIATAVGKEFPINIGTHEGVGLSYYYKDLQEITTPHPWSLEKIILPYTNDFSITLCRAATSEKVKANFLHFADRDRARSEWAYAEKYFQQDNNRALKDGWQKFCKNPLPKQITLLEAAEKNKKNERLSTSDQQSVDFLRQVSPLLRDLRLKNAMTTSKERLISVVSR